MSSVSRWKPARRFPLTKTIAQCFPMVAEKRVVQKADIVSETLCDQIIHRLSPFIQNKPPVDIIDLWPGAGLWSSKINDFLKPRRHVLVEPNLKAFGPLLKPLAESKPCYELLSMKIHTFDDWSELLSKHFPEQGPSNCDQTGALAKNDTLLVLASPPASASKRDHFTPARWWSVVMEAAMRQSGFHNYGAVRLLVALPTAEARAIMPRSIVERGRPALLTENIALHAFEVATTGDPAPYPSSKGFDLIRENAARVAERMVEQNIVTPDGRELPAPPMAPESPNPGQKPCPHVPRLGNETHERLIQTIKANENTRADDPNALQIRRRRTRALTQLNQDNRQAYIRLKLRDKQLEIDELTRSLSRAAADPNSTSKTLQPLLDQIAGQKSDLEKEHSTLHFEATRLIPSYIDETRAASQLGSFDYALLLWDRRPFEPLYIRRDELFPRTNDQTILYFEADANSPVMQRINEVDVSERPDLLRVFDAVSLAFSSRHSMTVAAFLQLMFPGRTINDMVRAVPSLAAVASKKPKENFDNLPKTVHGRPGDNEAGKELDPAFCFQENIDYDLEYARIRALPPATLWDIILEYQKSSMKVSQVQLTRVLGGTLTSFRAGDYGPPKKRLH